MSKILFILNPVSGTLNSNQKKEIIQKLNKVGEVRISNQAGHGFEIAQNAINENFEIIVAVGGDGTVNEIGKALINSKAILGIIPIGSGNGLARHLGIPMNFDLALNFVQNQKSNFIDVCFVNEIPFFCTSGLGLDAFVAHEFAKTEKRGFLEYIKITVKSMFQFKSEKLILNGIEYDDLFTLTIANASQYGNNAYISPNSKINDGNFEVVKIRKYPFYAALIMVIRLFFKSISESKYVSIEKFSEVEIETNGNAKIHFDGDPFTFETNRLVYKIQSKVLKVISAMV